MLFSFKYLQANQLSGVVISILLMKCLVGETPQFKFLVDASFTISSSVNIIKALVC